ncbi:hypothetical protein DXG01_011273 [Tephrocybe rancida]|nr:hypothetical protein DXG01_011273 [Tephrocybe rancida]
MGASASTARPARDLELLDLYEVLEVEENATVEEIKKAYHRQSREHHPDKNINDPGATKRFTRVLEAYETLADQHKRAIYNQKRAEAQSNPAQSPHSSSSQDIPGAWASKSNAIPEPDGWLGLLSRLLTWLLHALLWVPFKLMSPSVSPRQRFEFEEYVEQVRANPYDTAGISFEDIQEFVKSINGGSFEMKNDHDKAGLFWRTENFFLCIALDELLRGSGPLPRFGCAHSIWSYKDWRWDREAAHIPNGLHEVEDFYAHWSRFETKKSFEWVKPYAGDYYNHKQINKANKIAQNAARRDYNMVIRAIVEILLEVDPRHLTHLIRVDERAQRSAQDRPATGGNPSSAHPSRKGRRKKKGRRP